MLKLQQKQQKDELLFPLSATLLLSTFWMIIITSESEQCNGRNESSWNNRLKL